MIRMIMFLVILTLCFAGLIVLFRKMTGKEALKLIKLLGYAIISGLLAMAVTIGMVILF